MDKPDIIRDMLERMRYKASPDNRCEFCSHSEDEEEDETLLCALNPIYKFVTQPGATCAHHKSNNELHRLNSKDYGNI